MRMLVYVLAVVCGCTLANFTPQARFSDSANNLNDATRWGHLDMAMPEVSAKYQNLFLSRHRDWGGSLSIADSELVRMQLSEDRKTATTEVNVSWYATGGVTLRQTVITQKWEAERGHYRLIDEAVRAGDASLFAADEKAENPGKSDG